MHCCSFSTSNKIISKGCQSASKTCDFDEKNAKFFWGGDTAPPLTPPQWKGGHPLPTPHPPRRLDLNPSHSEIMLTLLTIPNPNPNTNLINPNLRIIAVAWSNYLI